MDTLDEAYIQELCSSGKTYQDISNTLQDRHPGGRGFSVRSVKRFCLKYGFTTRIPETEIVKKVK